MSKRIDYFVTSHTAHGFVNFLLSNIDHLQVLSINHPSLTLKTKVFKQLIDIFETKTIPIEVLVNGHSKYFIDGILLRSYGMALIGEHALTEEISPHEEITFVDININDFLLEKQREIDHLFTLAHQYLEKSLQAHQRIEADYIASMDFQRSDEQIQRIKKLLFRDKIASQTNGPFIRKRLFGSNTIEGNYHLVDQLLPLVKKRILLQGGPGTGKSFFMKEIIKKGLAMGYSVEKYMCSFDPSSIDMVTFPELSVSILDSTDVHAFSPISEKDLVIDLFDIAGLADVENIHREKFVQIREEQKSTRQQANAHLSRAGNKLKQLEKKLTADGTDHLDHYVSAVLDRLV